MMPMLTCQAAKPFHPPYVCQSIMLHALSVNNNSYFENAKKETGPLFFNLLNLLFYIYFNLFSDSVGTCTYISVTNSYQKERIGVN